MLIEMIARVKLSTVRQCVADAIVESLATSLGKG